MVVTKRVSFICVLGAILVIILGGGPAGAERQDLQDLVVTEYLLHKAGFEKWAVNLETPKRQALLNSIPQGAIITYRRDGKIYHVYGDQRAQTLYVGDEAAYQRYLSLAQGRKVCRRVEGGESGKFWSCMEEFEAGGGPKGK